MTIDETETIELLTMERGKLQAGNLGFSLGEAKSLLASGQRTLVDAQAAMHAQSLRCEICGEALRRKGGGTLVVRTLFGKMPVDSPRFYRCACSESEASSRSSFSPLAKILPDRTLPELQYLQVKWAASMSYGLTLEILRDVFPIGDALGKEAVRNNVARVARRLDAELGDEPAAAVQNESVAQAPSSAATAPLIIGIDGGYVRGRAGKAEKDGCFEVIVGKSIPAEGDAKCFGFVQRIEEKPKRRLQEVLDAQGCRADQPIVFLSDGADTVRNLQRNMSPNAEHILDWFHVTMRLTVMNNIAAGLRSGRTRRNALPVADLLERVKWNLWHGKVDRSLERAEELRKKLARMPPSSRDNVRKLQSKLAQFVGYIDANRTFVPNYGRRYRAGKPISTSFAESTVDQIISRRFVKKQQMRWTDQGCHNVLQIRTRVINDELRSAVQRWHPTSQLAA
jgi:hypothetical protein